MNHVREFLRVLRILCGATKRTLSVRFDWATGLWSVAHRALIQPIVDAIEARQRMDAADQAFPNGFGNYTSKRTPRELVNPLPPDERRSRLFAHLLSHVMTYRNAPRASDFGNLRYGQRAEYAKRNAQREALKWMLALNGQ